MKTFLISMLAVALLAGCASRSQQGQQFTLIWRETSETPIEKVETPKGFKISPSKAVRPIMARIDRGLGTEFYLFVDATNYYFGCARIDTDLRYPEADHFTINGATGKIAQSKKEDTEQSTGE